MLQNALEASRQSCLSPNIFFCVLLSIFDHNIYMPSNPYLSQAVLYPPPSLFNDLDCQLLSIPAGYLYFFRLLGLADTRFQPFV